MVNIFECEKNSGENKWAFMDFERTISVKKNHQIKLFLADNIKFIFSLKKPPN
jgi:hypothetical protein